MKIKKIVKEVIDWIGIIFLLFFGLVCIMSCDTRNSDGTYTPFGAQRVYIIDSCEYYGYLDAGNCSYLTHKGNCKFCTERRKQELRNIFK